MRAEDAETQRKSSRSARGRSTSACCTSGECCTSAVCCTSARHHHHRERVDTRCSDCCCRRCPVEALVVSAGRWLRSSSATRSCWRPSASCSFRSLRSPFCTLTNCPTRAFYSLASLLALRASPSLSPILCNSIDPCPFLLSPRLLLPLYYCNSLPIPGNFALNLNGMSLFSTLLF